jgi:hypothetical protein
MSFRAISIWRNSRSLKNGIYQPEETAVRLAGKQAPSILSIFPDLTILQKRVVLF